ncbi:MAG: MFS transporter [Anaerolineae bacterium]
MAEADTTPQANNEPIYRRNFLLFLTEGFLFMVALSVIGPSTLIPDFIRRLTSSEVMIGLSSSLFGVGWTLPQLLVARYIVRARRVKWWFVGPNIPVRLVILVFALITVLLGKEQPGAILVAFFICYSLAALGDGVVSVPWAMLTGTSLDSRWRARLFGLQLVFAGLVMLVLSPLIGIVLGSTGPGFPNNYALIFGAAGLLFAISTVPTLFIREIPVVQVVAKIPSLAEFLPSIGQVLRTDKPFRAMVITRMLTSLYAMAIPFYIGFATVQLGISSTVAVPVLLAMQTIGGLCGSLLLTLLGAHRNVVHIRLALGCAAFLPLSALLAGVMGPLPLYAGFLVSGVALGSIFLSFQNWIITYTTPNQRPLYTGLFNTLSTVITLLSPLIGGTIAQQVGYEELFIVALVMALGALYVALRHLPDPDRARLSRVPAVE